MREKRHLTLLGPTLFLALLLSGAPPLRAEEKDPPTPAERVAALREKLAGERANLGTWAAGKKLGVAAKAQFVLAVHLDPDCRRARQRLGHKRDDAGNWVPHREKDWEYGSGAVDKYGEALREKEAQILSEELEAFESLGVELVKEGHEDLGRPLLLRVYLLAPRRQRAARALGLSDLPGGFADSETADAIRDIPRPQEGGVKGVLESVAGVHTLTRSCYSVIAETVGARDSADKLAISTHRAQLLTCRRLALPPRGFGWITVFVANNQDDFFRFVDRVCGPGDAWGAACKQVGTIRGYMPRHFAGTWRGMGMDPEGAAPTFAHMAAEHVLLQDLGQGCPAWLYESAGIDACLCLLGVPGAPCVVLEESAGLSFKEEFGKPEGWGRLVLRKAALGDVPRLAGLLRAQLQALAAEDLIVGHLYYRYLYTARLDQLRGFVAKLIAEPGEPEKAFREAFGGTPEAVEAKLMKLLLGS